MKKTMVDIKNHLMTGISYALPVIIAGSLMVAVAKIVGLAFGVSDLNAFADSSGIQNWLYQTQEIGFKIIGLMNYILGAYVAYSIAGKKGLAAGFAAGLIASLTGSGFLGAAIGGLLAGYSSEWVSRKVQITGSAATSVPLIILPFITVGLQVVIMLLALGDALGWLNNALMTWVQQMTEDGTSTVVLAAVLGGMICFDLGGPVNKAAWGTANVLFLSGVYLPAILVNVAIIIPPLGYAAARFLRPHNFSQTLKEAGNGSVIMGILGISEGAIPFTLKNPARLIPLNVLAGTLGAVTVALLKAYPIMPPLGGLYGGFTVGHPWAYFAGALVGTLVIAIGANLLVNFNDDESARTADEKHSTEEIEIKFD
ncbi:PTS system IIC component (Fru family) [Enterobacter sp. BIGb0383]|uniref:PTS fructose transporter subunit IIC n=1 Tax=unclassified Enterobacter TaxID=2608935 RepID=UPI000F47BA47|nr:MULTISPECIES: PTS fructose transporter subunit IIC [unclassified Enterobacter]ROP62001.1 PTS system IIC component (Fru family) [Enterobacter sp. BIGb0383]ROS12162.1 PTS system IIC component (Fru family) [Enterobacter sp. BIGb0359]